MYVHGRSGEDIGTQRPKAVREIARTPNAVVLVRDTEPLHNRAACSRAEHVEGRKGKHGGGV